MLTQSQALKHLLSELTTEDRGTIEVYWDNPNGGETSSDESIAYIAQAALLRINELESAICQVIRESEPKNSLKTDDKGEMLQLLKELVNYQPSLFSAL